MGILPPKLTHEEQALLNKFALLKKKVWMLGMSTFSKIASKKKIVVKESTKVKHSKFWLQSVCSSSLDYLS